MSFTEEFQKAIDKIPDKRLLAEVKVHDIDGVVLWWLEIWLASCKEINSQAQRWLNLTSGVSLSFHMYH